MRSWHRSRSSGFTYAAVGATASLPPAGYVVDHTRIKLGEGEEVFTRAKAALRAMGAVPPGLGGGMAAQRHDRGRRGRGESLPASLGLWWLNACRIVYVVDESGPVHAVRLRLRDAARSRRGRARSGSLSNGIGRAGRSGTTSWRSPARNRLLARLGYPYMRRVQKRFGRESAAAMLKAVGNDAEERD